MMTSKYPEIKETIFSTISKMAAEHQALNLGQGFPDYDGHEYLKERLSFHTHHHHNQYAPMIGIPELRAEVKKIHSQYTELNIETEITITAGATEALMSTLMALVHPGDEVMVFDPAFDCYRPQIKMAQGVPVSIPLKSPDFKIDWNLVAGSLTSKTKFILLNFPHNPCGSVLSHDDLDQLYQITKDKDIKIISDEVYQYMVFDDQAYHSPFYDPRLREKTIKIASFGKMFHMTGWKTGYILAGEDLSQEIRKVHQYNTFCSFAPAQFALADMMAKFPEHPFTLAKFYQTKRDLFVDSIQNSKLRILPSHGSYFQIIDFSDLTQMQDFDLAIKLIRENKIAAIPISGFYATSPQEGPYLRFSFAKTSETLTKASEILNRL